MMLCRGIHVYMWLCINEYEYTGINVDSDTLSNEVIEEI